jgi:hypothetical protein
MRLRYDNLDGPWMLMKCLFGSYLLCPESAMWFGRRCGGFWVTGLLELRIEERV